MVFNKPERVFVAYADRQGLNEMVIRDGDEYFILTSNQEIFSLTETEAQRTLKLVAENVLHFRGTGLFSDGIKIMKGDM